MGLLLSILVVCVGVIEALSCYEHFQYGVLHYATNVYENARRRSSLFLKYTSDRLKLMSENSVPEYDEIPQEILQPVRSKRKSAGCLERYRENSGQKSDRFTSLKRSETILKSTERPKKLDKEEKMFIVKSLLEKPGKPKVIRSLSMPELIYTEKDIELTNLINNLAIEPIEEIDIEIEDVNAETLTEEFNKIFDEYENPSSNACVSSSLIDSKGPISQSKNKVNSLPEAEVGKCKTHDIVKESVNIENFENLQKDDVPDLRSEAEIKICSRKTMECSPVASLEKDFNEKSLLQKNEKNHQTGRLASVDIVKAPSIRFNKSLSEDLDIPSYFNKKSNVSSQSDSLLDELIIVDESISCNKLDDTIFEYDPPSLEVINTTFEKIYNEVWDESLDLTSTYEEIEKNVLSKDDDYIINLEGNSSKSKHMSCAPNLDLSKEKALLTNATNGETISNDGLVKAIEQLAELVVKDLLNLDKIKGLILQNLTSLNTFISSEKLGFTEIGMQAFDTFRHSQLERNATDENHKSKSNVPIKNVKDYNENENGEDEKAFQKLSKCCEENQIKVKSETAEENDLTNVRQDVNEDKIQIIDSSNIAKENSNLFDDFIPEMTFTESDAVAPLLDEKQKPQEKFSSLESITNGINIFSKIEEKILISVGENTEEETLKDFPESENREIENIAKALSYEPSENDAEQEMLKISFKTENLFREANDKTNVKCNEFGKVEDLLKNEEEKESERIAGEFEKEIEIQSENVTTIYVNLNTLSETEKTFTCEGETLLGLECNEGIKCGENEKEIMPVEQRAKQDIGNINLEELLPVNVMESVVKETLKLHKKVEETEESVECERVGTIRSNLAEAEELLSSEKPNDTKEVSSDCSEVNLCWENKGEHSSAAEGDTEIKSSDSAPEAFWLIFSGEYTKAMSKDWHSGHFSCWQCDEALTGQRYVLRDDHPYCIKCYESVFANVCEECNKIIGIDSKDLSYKDKHWHEACFLCNKCRVSLVDKQFGSKADKIYCGNCYDAQFASRCDGCGEIFRAGTKKMEYKTRQWHEKCFCCCVCKTPIGTKSFIPREQEIYCATCYEEKFATRCVKCNKIITSGGVTYKNEPWHRECFTCTNCNTSLAGQRFTSRDEKPYCADCFGELFAKRCTACSKPITGIGGTRFISFEDRHWHNDCFICASCKTSLVGRGFITDGDDIICPECAKQKLM